MKRTIITLLTIVALHGTAVACDVCGCALGGNYFGILPLYNKNFVGLRWSQASFHSRIDATRYLPAEESNDTYQKMELWARFYATNRLQFMAFVPYIRNRMDGTLQQVTTQGLGDVTMLANFLVVNTGERDSAFKQTLMAGGGIKLPTGVYNQEDRNKIINPNFQAGTGSVDFQANAVYTIRYKRAGFNTEVACKLNTRNRTGYLFGNQFRASSMFFYWQQAGSIALLPHAGLNFETSGRHDDRNILQVNTGGSNQLVALGIDLYAANVTMGVNYQTPVAQNYHSEPSIHIVSRDRWSVSLTYNF